MLVVTDQLTKDYGRFRALDGLSLGIAPGEIFGLLGPNGSGKSTAIRLLLGFLRPTAGHARVAGYDCWRNSVAVRRRVGYLPGELRLYENMTGRQLIRFLCQLRGESVPKDTDAVARRLDIDIDRPLVQMSSGMKRKVALLAVLLPPADLLILDEPTNTLDPTMRDQLLLQLQQAKERGQTVLFSSHVLGEVERLCDRVGILQRGRLVHLQKMSELNASARLVRVHFARPPESLPELPGLESHQLRDHYLTLEYQGTLTPLLDWLSQQAIVDLRIEPLGLGPVYHRYHGAEQ
jgi:ABC-2 type transport system ATP-binding protein